MMDVSAIRMLLRNSHHANAFRQLWRRGPLTISQMAADTSLTLSTLHKVVDDLLQADLIQVQPHHNNDPVLLLKPGGGYIIGIDIGGTRVTAALMDLAGEQQHALEVLWDEMPRRDEHDLEPLFTLIDRLIAACPGLVIGIGVGAPGVTHPGSGVVSWAPGPRWRDMPLKDAIEQRFRIPAAVENDVNLATLGELYFGVGRHKRHFICIMIGTGIGAGIVINGALYRGANHAAGEVGYMVPSTDFLAGTYISFGALESVASGTGIAQQATIAHTNAGADVTYSAEEVFQLAANGQPWATAIVDQTGRYLAQMIANVCAVLDPECVVLGGGVTRDIRPMLETILAHLSHVLPILPTLILSEMGAYAAVRGAITLVIDDLTGGHETQN